MKIVITGGTAGIGLALAKLFEADNHEVLALSRRNGYNIRSLPKVAGMIEPCDMFINNAQAGFAQTELLWEVWRRWQGQDKVIVNISTQMVLMQYASKPEWDEYLVQKKTLELAQEAMANRSELPMLILERPGAIATQPGQTVPLYKDVDEYAREVVNRLRDITNG
jgi:NAD(P)-dependent dehydrogenase (short-subunit alcohol dehydrogenase family)